MPGQQGHASSRAVAVARNAQRPSRNQAFGGGSGSMPSSIDCSTVLEEAKRAGCRGKRGIGSAPATALPPKLPCAVPPFPPPPAGAPARRRRRPGWRRPRPARAGVGRTGAACRAAWCPAAARGTPAAARRERVSGWGGVGGAPALRQPAGPPPARAAPGPAPPPRRACRLMRPSPLTSASRNMRLASSTRSASLLPSSAGSCATSSSRLM